MEERYRRGHHFGPMVLAVVVGGLVLRHLAEHEHSMGHGSHHERFSKLLHKHHARCHDWAEHHFQEAPSEEKPGDAA